MEGYAAKMRRLRERSPEEWRRLLDGVRDTEAGKRAECVVWWDFLSDGRGTVAPRPRYGAGFEADEKDVERALRGMGYPPEQAAKRSRPPRTQTDCAPTREAE